MSRLVNVGKTKERTYVADATGVDITVRPSSLRPRAAMVARSAPVKAFELSGESPVQAIVTSL